MKSKYGTSVMKEKECLLLVQTALENGSDPNQAIQDMRMIDTLLSVKRNHLLAFGTVKKTRAGYYRRNSTLANALENVIDARVNGFEM